MAAQLVSVRAVDPKQDAQLAAGPVSMFSFFAASPAEAMTFYSPQCMPPPQTRACLEDRQLSFMLKKPARRTAPSLA